MTKRICLCIALIAAILLAPLAVTAQPLASPTDSQEGGCLPLFFDKTAPDLAKLLENAIWIPVGQPQVRYKGGTKIVQQPFMFESLDGEVLPCADEDCGGEEGGGSQGTLKCTSTCTGNGCSIQGCDIWANTCSACSCFGCTANCTCTKEVTK